ncbi:MAG TPA: queuosine precursor transporter [Rhabdochlamydiaceae bacterium]|jgi:hypothetical protein
MNELLFFLHLILIFGFGVIALKLGKSYLTTWVAIQAILANLFVVKQMHFFHFNITCSDAFAIGSILGLNLLQEYFDAQSAKRALWGAFFAMLFFATMSQVHLLYIPSAFDTTQEAFKCLLSPSPRLFAASVLVFLISQQLDIRLFHFFKRKAHLLPFAVRSSISTILSQFIDTLLFSFLGLWGLVSSLWDIIFVSFLIKIAIIAFLIPLIALIKRIAPGQPHKVPL